MLAYKPDAITIGLMTRRVLLYPGEDGFIVAEVPSLPGCISQGKTRDEALANVREAISLHEEVLLERGESCRKIEWNWSRSLLEQIACGLRRRVC